LPRVSIPNSHTTPAAIAKHSAPSANTPPCPVIGNTSPVTNGPSSEPTRPMAEANPEPVARAEVGYSSGV